jgi:hypothetical protein
MALAKRIELNSRYRNRLQEEFLNMMQAAAQREKYEQHNKEVENILSVLDTPDLDKDIDVCVK